MVHRSLFNLALLSFLAGVSGFASTSEYGIKNANSRQQQATALKMVDQNVIMGAGVAFAGLAVGIGLVAFTEVQGERAAERGGGLSEGMSTKIAGGLLEDVEVSSVADLGSLTSQLENALKSTGATNEKAFEITEEEKQRMKEEADDGW